MTDGSRRAGRDWLRPAAAIFVVGWGANMFAPLLDVYRGALSSVETTGLFAAYVLGLIPALILVAPLSDRWGRRSVLRPVVLLSAVGSLVLLLAGDSFFGLLVGRIVVGVAAGAAFGPGTAWIKEHSERADRAEAGAPRAAIALTAGFAVGPLVSGVLAQWLPAPAVTPYVVQIVLALVALAYLWTAPETVARGIRSTAAGGLRTVVLSRVFLGAVVTTAPWVFGAATAALAALPGQVDLHGFDELGSGLVAAVTLGTGLAVQPWARRLRERSQPAPFNWGLGLLVAGLLLGALTALTHSAILLAVTSVALGAAYGLLLVSGLGLVSDIAPPGALAALTAIFYSLSYLGFALPLLDSVFTPTLTSPGFFVVAAALAAACFLGVAAAWRGR